MRFAAGSTVSEYEKLSDWVQGFLRALLLQRVQRFLLEISVCSGFFATACDVCTKMYLELRENGSPVGDIAGLLGLSTAYRHGTQTQQLYYFSELLDFTGVDACFFPWLGTRQMPGSSFFIPNGLIQDISAICPQRDYNMTDFAVFIKCLFQNR